MRLCFRPPLAAVLLVASLCARAANYLDIAPFAQITTWHDAQPQRFTDIRAASNVNNLGLEWDEERDIRELRVRYAGAAPNSATVEYWFNAWPWDPPTMPSIEDPMDDPWQGKWLKATAA